jgi:hypothetical protein
MIYIFHQAHVDARWLCCPDLTEILRAGWRILMRCCFLHMSAYIEEFNGCRNSTALCLLASFNNFLEMHQWGGGWFRPRCRLSIFEAFTQCSTDHTVIVCIVPTNVPTQYIGKDNLEQTTQRDPMHSGECIRAVRWGHKSRMSVCKRGSLQSWKGT